MNWSLLEDLALGFYETDTLVDTLIKQSKLKVDADQKGLGLNCCIREILVVKHQKSKEKMLGDDRVKRCGT